LTTHAIRAPDALRFGADQDHGRHTTAQERRGRLYVAAQRHDLSRLTLRVHVPHQVREGVAGGRPGGIRYLNAQHVERRKF
jgi:hypothetical protein